MSKIFQNEGGGFVNQIDALTEEKSTDQSRAQLFFYISANHLKVSYFRFTSMNEKKAKEVARQQCSPIVCSIGRTSYRGKKNQRRKCALGGSLLTEIIREKSVSENTD